MIEKKISMKSIKKYLNQDINNPTYLFHGSPYKLTKITPKLSHDSNNNLVNIAEAIFLFPSFIKATAYAFKDTIKKNSVNLEWDFKISNYDEIPVMIMENVNIDENVIGYIYVFNYDSEIKKDEGCSLQYKSYKELVPIDIVEIKYKDYKNYYKIVNKCE